MPGELWAFANADNPGGPAWIEEEHEVHRWCRLLRHLGVATDPADLSLAVPAVSVPRDLPHDLAFLVDTGGLLLPTPPRRNQPGQAVTTELPTLPQASRRWKAAKAMPRNTTIVAARTLRPVHGPRPEASGITAMTRWPAVIG